MTNSYSIGDVSLMTNVSEKKLRYWQEKNYLKDVQRVICGKRRYRVFTKEQVEFIKRIKFYLDQGYTLPVSAEKTKLDFKGDENYGTKND